MLTVLAALALMFRDADIMADRRVAVTAPAPAPHGMAVAAALPTGPAAEVAVVAASSGGLPIRYRNGLLPASATVYPLTDPTGNVATTGYAIVRAGADGQAAAEAAMAQGVWLGFLDVPPAMDSAARRELNLPPGAVAVMLHDAPRETVLLRSVRSPWRAVLFWLAAVMALASYILTVEQSRISAERSRLAVTRGWLTDARALTPPLSDKARARFDALAAAEELSAPGKTKPPKPLLHVLRDKAARFREQIVLRGPDAP